MTSHLVIDPTASSCAGSLVLDDPVRFEGGRPELLPGAAARLDFAAGVAWQFDEILMDALGEGDHARFEDEAIELANQRAATIRAYLEFRGVEAVEVTVRTRVRGAVEARGAAQLRPADRVLTVRITRPTTRW